MQLLNVRIGFASNSSSMHSVIMVKTPSKIKTQTNKYNRNLGFGQEIFVLPTEKAIDMYLAAQYFENLSRAGLSMKEMKEAVYTMYPSVRGKDISETATYIDHQSVWTIPHAYGLNSSYPSKQLMEDIKEYLLEKKCIIVGGSDCIDTDDYPEILHVKPEEIDRIETKLSNCLGSGDLIGPEYWNVCLKDGDVWKIFHRSNGFKLRFSFKDDVVYEKSSTPELVDLIVSDKCSIGCRHCYRGCTPDGKWADISIITKWVRALRALQVFEVAIGGGDIMEHPQIYDLCEHFRNTMKKYDIVFNTTVNIKSIKPSNMKIFQRILNSFRGIAISVASAEDILYAEEVLDQFTSVCKISYQMIPELLSYETLVKMMNTLRQIKKFRMVTFLGFKHTGRGNSSEFSTAEFERNKESFRKLLPWMDDPKQMYSRYGVDTQLLKNFPEIKENAIKWTYSEHEGKFSCCIDAVNNYVLPSSYTEYKDEYKINPQQRWVNLAAEVKNRFQEF